MSFVEKTQVFGESLLELIAVRLESFAECYKCLVMCYFVQHHPKKTVFVEVGVDAYAVPVIFQRIGKGIVAEFGLSGAAYNERNFVVEQEFCYGWDGWWRQVLCKGVAIVVQGRRLWHRFVCWECS